MKSYYNIRPDQQIASSINDIHLPMTKWTTTSLPNLTQLDEYRYNDDINYFNNRQEADDDCNNHANTNNYASCEEISRHEPFESTQPSESECNRWAWERGQPDYMGMNAFENIKARLDWQLGLNNNDNNNQNQPPLSESNKENNDNYDCEQNTEYDIATNELNTETDIASELLPDNTDTNVSSPIEEEIEIIPIPEDNRNEWESGNPDYLGKASFDFILQRIQANVEEEQQPSKDVTENESGVMITAADNTYEGVNGHAEEEEEVKGPEMVEMATQTMLSTLAPYTERRVTQ